MKSVCLQQSIFLWFELENTIREIDFCYCNTLATQCQKVEVLAQSLALNLVLHIWFLTQT